MFDSTSDSIRPPALLEGVEKALNTLKVRIVDRFGPRLRRLVLFGSYARGEAGPDSDVDVLVVIDLLTNRERSWVYEIGAEVWMETSIRLAPAAFSDSEWNETERRELLLADDVNRQGIPL
jgi:predicted nucleotidyltransferase